jgi:hypothetical protein
MGEEDLKKAKKIPETIEIGKTRAGEHERDDFLRKTSERQKPGKEYVSKEEFVKKETKINKKRIKQIEKRSETETIPTSLQEIKWSINGEENDRIYFKEERVNEYEWVMNMEKELSRYESNVKIITLIDKWKYIVRDNSDDGRRCINLIQGKAIATAYEQRNYGLMHQIAIRASNTEPQNYFSFVKWFTANKLTAANLIPYDQSKGLVNANGDYPSSNEDGPHWPEDSSRCSMSSLLDLM